ncbi:hypothetical protein AKO1_002609 [Acrasis kona]|uniref:Uncharacterized protein n=1 Tax=Acrasis kona TaxID=1008807 RepID=A0AAW2Z122_9EUKA
MVMILTYIRNQIQQNQRPLWKHLLNRTLRSQKFKREGKPGVQCGIILKKYIPTIIY